MRKDQSALLCGLFVLTIHPFDAGRHIAQEIGACALGGGRARESLAFSPGILASPHHIPLFGTQIKGHRAERYKDDRCAWWVAQRLLRIPTNTSKDVAVRLPHPIIWQQLVRFP